VSVTAVVVRDDGRILAIKRMDDGRWVPPSGVLELNEAPEECAAREVLEETGYRISVEVLTGVYKNMKLGVVSLAFRCRLSGGSAATSSESSAVDWLTLDEVKLLMPGARAIRVIDAFVGGEAVPVRVHDDTNLL
jgi:8-oxo-dGTP diphosphatase